MKKVLIIVPPVRLSESPHRFPLGLGYIAATLEKDGCQVSVLDLNLLRLSPVEEEQQIQEALKGQDVVALGGMVTMLKTISRITDIVKKYAKEIPVIVGGPIASNFQELVLQKTAIDILFLGEGEDRVSLLVDLLVKGDSIESIAGVVFLKDGHIVKTKEPERITDLDMLSSPAYHLFDYQTYTHNHGYTADIVGSRGCPFTCSFCHRNFGNKVFFRSVKSITQEILFLKEMYGVKHIHLEDELFVQREDFVFEFCNEIIKLSNITWSACARANKVSPDIIKKLKASNCMSLMIGLESFDEDVLKSMNKRSSVAENEQACDWMNLYGLEIKPGFIIGMPGETKESVKRTVNACIRHRISVNEWQYAFATPYPGTQLYEEAKIMGIIKDDWDYLEKLCEVGDTKNLTVNMTAFLDEELIALRDQALITIENQLNPLNGLINKDYIKFDEAIDYSQYIKNFKMIEIETFSYCNRICWFCPNTIVDRRKNNQYMSEDIYLEILMTLKANGFNGTISFSRYNEPFADEIIFKRIAQAKELLPHCELISNTNGDYITKEVLLKAEKSGLSRIQIQIYMAFDKGSIEIEAQKRIKQYQFEMIKSVDKSDWLQWDGKLDTLRVKLYARDFEKNGTDRGGVIDKLKGDNREAPCFIPFQNIYIDYNGKVMPCCNLRSDLPAHQAYIFGDVNEVGLINALFNYKACSVRKAISSFDSLLTVCATCSFCFNHSLEQTVNMLYQSGYFYEKTGFVKEAISLFEKVTSYSDKETVKSYLISSFFHLGQLYDNNEKKKYALSECLKIEPNHLKAKERLMALAKL